MLEPVREKFVKNGVVMENWQYDPAWFRGRKTIYEVMRVMNGSPVFLAEHLDRFIQSATKAGIPGIPAPEEIAKGLKKLLDSNPSDDGNIQCCLVRENGKAHFLSWFVEHHYPGPEDYENGVKLRSLKAIRKQPGIKAWNAELRSKTGYLLKNSDVYEILLIDRKGHITEGSRSNVFCIRGNTVFTPPETRVLPGITRQKVLQICEENLVRVVEKEIPYKELAFYESVFISGTSPRVLPVVTIDKYRFNPQNDILKRLMAAYDQLIEAANGQ